MKSIAKGNLLWWVGIPMRCRACGFRGFTTQEDKDNLRVHVNLKDTRSYYWSTPDKEWEVEVALPCITPGCTNYMRTNVGPTTEQLRVTGYLPESPKKPVEEKKSFIQRLFGFFTQNDR